jgi:predicted  nucleic acid-binding Zn-ribbon protein
MTFDTNISLGNVLTMGVMFFGAAGAWFSLKYSNERTGEKIGDLDKKWTEKLPELSSKSRVDMLQRDVDENTRQRNALWKAIEDHNKEANEQREKFMYELVELRGELNGVMKMYDKESADMKERLKRIEEKIDELKRGT